MKTHKYKVVYEIEVDAESCMDAALQVEEIMKNSHYRPFLMVSSQEAHECQNIDLEEWEEM